MDINSYSINEVANVLERGINAAVNWSVSNDENSIKENVSSALEDAKSDIAYRKRKMAGCLVALLDYPYGLEARVRKMVWNEERISLEKEELVELNAIVPVDSSTYMMRGTDGKTYFGKMVAKSRSEATNTRVMFALSANCPEEGQEFGESAVAIAGVYDVEGEIIIIKRNSFRARVNNSELLDNSGLLHMAEMNLEGMDDEAYLTTIVRVI